MDDIFITHQLKLYEGLKLCNITGRSLSVTYGCQLQSTRFHLIDHWTQLSMLALHVAALLLQTKYKWQMASILHLKP